MGGSIEKMVAHAVDIANDDTHGYSWADRWDTDRDCASFIYDSANVGGYAIGRGPDRTRYTGTMIDDFTAAGFAWLDYGGTLVRGDILLRDPWGSGHTELYIGNGQTVGAHIAETGGVYGQPGDQTGNEISITPNPGGWDFILRPPADKKPEQKPGKAYNNKGMKYRAHVQNLGWCDWVHDGQTAGTVGFSLRLEAITFEPPEGVTLRVKVHQETRGWSTYQDAKHGAPVTVGTTGQSKRLEGICIEAIEMPKGWKLEYRVHVQDYGWLAWTPAGYATGSDGQHRRIEAVQIRMVKNG